MLKLYYIYMCIPKCVLSAQERSSGALLAKKVLLWKFTLLQWIICINVLVEEVVRVLAENPMKSLQVKFLSLKAKYCFPLFYCLSMQFMASVIISNQFEMLERLSNFAPSTVSIVVVTKHYVYIYKCVDNRLQLHYITLTDTHLQLCVLESISCYFSLWL